MDGELMAIHRFQSVAVEHAVNGLAFDGIRDLSAIQEFRQLANRGIEELLECDARFCGIANLRGCAAVNATDPPAPNCSSLAPLS
jgi:hypothetical protein